jgi:hypothetical protein
MLIKRNILDIFYNLHGTWKIKRHITNFVAQNSSGLVLGQAVFKQIKAHTLYYHEYGSFITAEQEFKISQEYVYVFNMLSQQIEKHFVKPLDTLFYLLNYQNLGIFTGQHGCLQDYYLAQYDFGIKPRQEFNLEYKVYGPNKNYIATTHYQKISF